MISRDEKSGDLRTNKIPAGPGHLYNPAAVLAAALTRSGWRDHSPIGLAVCAASDHYVVGLDVCLQLFTLLLDAASHDQVWLATAGHLELTFFHRHLQDATSWGDISNYIDISVL